MAKPQTEQNFTDPALLTREGLLPTAEATTGETPSDQEQIARLSTALGYYDTAALHDGFVRMAEQPEWRRSMIARYGKFGFSNMLAGKMAIRDEALAGAETEYYAAIGLTGRPQDYGEEARAQYRRFAATFQGNSELRRQKRQEYQAHYAALLAGHVVVGTETSSPAERLMQPFQPKARVNLSRALQPNFSGVLGAEHDTITMVDMQDADPRVLIKTLVNVGSRRHNALGYPSDESNPRKLTQVVFSPRGWTLMLRSSAEHRADIAVNKSKETQRQLQRTHEPNDPDAPRRAGIHILEGDESRMTAYQSNIVQPSLRMIERFKEASNYQGNLLRFGNEMNMRIQLDYLWNEAIDEMLWAAADVNKWDDAEERTHRLALEKAVFGTHDPAGRLKNFGLVLDALEEWFSEMNRYIEYKQAEIERYYDKHQTPEERQARERQRLQAAA